MTQTLSPSPIINSVKLNSLLDLFLTNFNLFSVKYTNEFRTIYLRVIQILINKFL